MYDINEHLPEIYDQLETRSDDVDFLCELLKKMKSPRILEPFCGNGRILFPLIKKGYQVTGIDLSSEMLDHLRNKIKRYEDSLLDNVQLINADVLKTDWPNQFDLVVLGGNCMYELATLDEQQIVIEKAFHALKTGGLVFIDNDNMEGLLDESWCKIGVEEKIFPSGECPHGVKMQGYCKPIWVDRENRLWKAQRRIEVEYPDGKKDEISYVQQKHPVSASEIKKWLEDTGLEILAVYAGTKNKKKFTEGAKRATFLAGKI